MNLKKEIEENFEISWACRELKKHGWTLEMAQDCVNCYELYTQEDLHLNDVLEACTDQVSNYDGLFNERLKHFFIGYKCAKNGFSE